MPQSCSINFHNFHNFFIQRYTLYLVLYIMYLHTIPVCCVLSPLSLYMKRKLHSPRSLIHFFLFWRASYKYFSIVLLSVLVCMDNARLYGMNHKTGTHRIKNLEPFKYRRCYWLRSRPPIPLNNAISSNIDLLRLNYSLIILDGSQDEEDL